ncbi:MAG: protease pro-enzyme activation domain-containing protein, partial [Bryobacteraceae bacterium]
KRVQLAGSERSAHPKAALIGAVVADEAILVTVYLRRQGEGPAVSLEAGAQQAPAASAEFSGGFGADPQDIALIEAFAHEYGLTVIDSSIPKRRVIVSGTAQAIAKAFGTDLRQYRMEATGEVFRGQSGAIAIPQELDRVVVAVLGLDNRPIAEPHFRIRAASPPAGAFTPTQVAALYNFPAGVTGSTETIGIIELGGGYSTADLKSYFAKLGLAAPKVVAVSVDGGKNAPGSSADAEVMLDIEVAGAVAPGAGIAVYFAPNTDQGFIDAITDAVHDSVRKPSVVSISWGGPEDSWTKQSQTAMNSALQDAAALGVTVTAAAGDSGSSDGVGDGKLHADFPASSPYALACGGTRMTEAANRIASETVWNETTNNEGATGGGVSNVFAKPAYQSAANVPQQPETQFAGRGVPDIAADADPSTGYDVLVGGQNEVIGGTSAVAPLWAGLIALINEHAGTAVGFVNPKLYSITNSAAFRDITSGNNDDSDLGYYSAAPGWDACTGLGTPDGAALLEALTAGTASAERVRLPGSTAAQRLGERFAPAAKKDDEITATVVLRRQGEAGEDLLSGDAPRMTRHEAERAISASPSDIGAVAAFAKQYGLKILEEDRAARTLRIGGTIRQMEEAFGVGMGWVTDAAERRHLSYRSAISIPKPLAGIVVAVLGLDTRPAARHGAEAG